MDNLIHKRGQENSHAVGQAKKIAKLNAGDDLVHPFNKFKGIKNIFEKDSTI